MDANVIACHLTDGHAGHPAGDFYSAVLMALSDHAPDARPARSRRLAQLLEIIHRADDGNLARLSDGLPVGTVDILLRHWRGELSHDEMLGRLAHTLDALPWLLLLSFPELKNAIHDYADRDLTPSDVWARAPSGKWLASYNPRVWAEAMWRQYGWWAAVHVGGNLIENNDLVDEREAMAWAEAQAQANLPEGP